MKRQPLRRLLANSWEMFQCIDQSFDRHRKIRHARCVAYPRDSSKLAANNHAFFGSHAYIHTLRSRRSAAGCDCHYDTYDEATTRLFLTENTLGTLFARMPARFLSASLSVTPSSVTLPFFTIMWIDGTA